jgi:phospholipid/cholesterol/gamma-HCH transport system substrate-binding protein
VLELAIDPAHGPIHADATVQVRTKSIVGENYVSLDPGTRTSQALREGGLLGIARAKPSVQLDQILSTISSKRRAHLRRLLSGLGHGVADSQAVNDMIGGLSDTIMSGTKVADALAVQREALANLVSDLGPVFRAVGERRLMIQRLVRGAKGAATAVAAQDRALRGTLRELPPTLVGVRAATAHLAAVGDHAAPVLDDLTAALQRLSPVARALPAAVDPTLHALNALATSAPAARRLLRSLKLAGGPLTGLVPSLDDTLRELRPALDYMAPYSKDFAAFFATTGQLLSSRDATGHVARLVPIFNTNGLAQIGPAQQQAIERLVGEGIGQLLNLRGTNAYPKPGTAAQPSAFTGSYPRIKRDG